ncbi:MAG: alpha/beta fold hydrolase [Bacteroidia bacterium]
MFHSTIDKQRLYYEVQGDLNSKRTLVLLNGLSQSTLAWALMTPILGKNNRIILLDLIFQGQSDKKGEWRDFDQHAADVKGLLDELKIEHTVVIGLSYGSLVAQHFALMYPEKLEKLILMSTFAHKTPYYRAIETAWEQALKMGGYPLLLDIMLPSVLSEGYFKNPLIPIEMMKEARKDLNMDAAALMKLMNATKERPDYLEKLKGLRTSTLIIQGEKDTLFPVHMAEAVQQSIPGSKLEVIPGVGHTLNLEAIPQSLALINSFIA